MGLIFLKSNLIWNRMNFYGNEWYIDVALLMNVCVLYNVNEHIWNIALFMKNAYWKSQFTL